MSELVSSIKKIMHQYPDIVTWSVAAVIVLLAILLHYKWLKEWYCEWRLNRTLKNAGVAALHNVAIPDGMEGNIFIEHLILTAENIYLLAVKKYRGLIFAAEKIDLWTQVIGNKSYKFDNPLHQLDNDVPALNVLCKQTKIQPRVLFIHGSEFPKGKPEHIVSEAEVKQWGSDNTSVSSALQQDWDRLVSLAQKSDLLQGKGDVIDAHSSGRWLSLLVFVLLLFFWLGWRLLN